MKLILIALISLSLSQNLFAGDAGYASKTCTSGSQRTVLTQLSDWGTNFDEIRIYTLIIDGVPAVYDTSEANVTETGDDGYLTISKDGKPAFSIQGPEGTITVLQDPRKGTIAENNASPTPLTIGVSCQSYWPEP